MKPIFFIKTNIHGSKYFGLMALMLALFFMPQLAKASHLLGGQLEFVSPPNQPNFGRLKLTLYADLGTIGFGTSVTVKQQGVSTAFNCNKQLDTVIGVTCQDSIRVAVFYSSFINLGQNIATFYYSECCRTSNTSNLLAASQGLYIPLMVRRPNAAEPFPLSPIFIQPSNVIISANTTSQISFAANSNQGDSLYYDFVAARRDSSTTGANLPYKTGYSFSAPFGTSVVSYLDGNSGLLTVVNPLIGNYNLVVRVSAFRNGFLTSRIFKDVEIKVKGTTVNTYQPTNQIDSVYGNVTFTKVDSTYTVVVYENEAAYISVSGSATMPTGVNSPILNLKIAGGDFISSNNGGPCVSNNCIELTGNLIDTASVNGVLKFKPPSGFVGMSLTKKNVTVDVYTQVADWCGGYRLAHQTIIFDVRRTSVFALNDSLAICEGDSTQATISGNIGNIIWSPTTGVSNPTSANPTLFPSSTTIYTITNLIDNATCRVKVYVKKDTILANILEYNNMLTHTSQFGGALATWYYNNIPLVKSVPTVYGINGAYNTLMPSSFCEIKSDTVVVNILKNSALVDKPFPSIKYLPNVKTVSFILEGTTQTNIIDQIYIVHRKVTVPISFYCQIVDLTTGQIVHYENMTYDNVKFLITIGSSPMNLPLTPTSRYKITLASLNSKLYDFYFYKEGNFPFVDSKNCYKITQSDVLTTNTQTYLDYHLPLVVGFANEVISVEEQEKEALFTLYPNPAHQNITVNSGSAETLQLTIYSVNGAILRQFEVVGKTDFYVGDLPAGMYYYVATGATANYQGQLVRQ